MADFDSHRQDGVDDGHVGLQVAELPVSEFQELWREYVAAFGELIRQADHDARSAAALHLVRASPSCVEPCCAFAFRWQCVHTR